MYFYNSTSGQCLTEKDNSWNNAWSFLDNATFAGTQEYFSDKFCNSWWTPLSKNKIYFEWQPKLT